MNAYKVTIRQESKNISTGSLSLSAETEQYFSEYKSADAYARTRGEMEVFGEVESGEVRVTKYSADEYAGIFETSELVSRTVVNITIVKIH